jgi:hypothetical protein
MAQVRSDARSADSEAQDGFDHDEPRRGVADDQGGKNQQPRQWVEHPGLGLGQKRVSGPIQRIPDRELPARQRAACEL